MFSREFKLRQLGRIEEQIASISLIKIYYFLIFMHLCAVRMKVSLSAISYSLKDEQ